MFACRVRKSFSTNDMENVLMRSLQEKQVSLEQGQEHYKTMWSPTLMNKLFSAVKSSYYWWSIYIA
jgi:hypothetical protein